MNTITGVRQVDAVYIHAAQNLGAGKRTMFIRVIIIGFLGLAIDTGMSQLNNYLLRWYRGMEN